MSENSSNQAAADDQEILGARTDSSSAEKPTDQWVTGDEPATAAQKSYLDNLARQAGDEIPAAGLTKAEASDHIDRLQQDDSTST